MKRSAVHILVLAAGVCLMVFGARAFAQDDAAQKTQPLSAFIDENGNGICDNFENGRSGMSLALGRTGGKGNRGRNFVDTDDEGVFDSTEQKPGKGFGRTRINAGAGTLKTETTDAGVKDSSRPGRGFGSGRGRGKGVHGNNFIEADGDDIFTHSGIKPGRGIDNAKASHSKNILQGKQR